MNRPKPTPEIMPEVGMGATMGVGSDSYPYTIVQVSKTGKSFKMVRDIATAVSGSGHDGSAVYEYARDPSATIESAVMVRLDHKGRWRQAGAPVGIGFRRYYQDPHF